MKLLSEAIELHAAELAKRLALQPEALEPVIRGQQVGLEMLLTWANAKRLPTSFDFPERAARFVIRLEVYMEEAARTAGQDCLP